MWRVTTYYNEIDPFAAAWLRNLIAAGHIPPGEVDERDIRDIRPDDLRGYTQQHFFAGIGGWAHAARLAGWPDDRPLATGSCPCQPFSSAGKGAGFDDERHLWPAFHHLIGVCEFPVVLGEQVASPDGLNWLDLVQTDMEASDYSGGAVDLCSAGVGAPNIRQRLYFAYWLAHPDGQQHDRIRDRGTRRRDEHSNSISAYSMAHPMCAGREPSFGDDTPTGHGIAAQPAIYPQRLANPDMSSQYGGAPSGEQPIRLVGDAGGTDPLRRSGTSLTGWDDPDWLLCRNPRGEPEWRPVESGTFPLVAKLPNRMGLLRGYGNALNVKVAQTFIEAVMECLP